MFDNTIAAAVITVFGGAAIASIADRIRLGTRVSVMERLNDERNKTIDSLSSAQKDHSDRIKAVEGVLIELKNFVDLMKDVPRILSRLDALMENDRKNISNLEDHVFKH